MNNKIQNNNNNRNLFKNNNNNNKQIKISMNSNNNNNNLNKKMYKLIIPIITNKFTNNNSLRLIQMNLKILKNLKNRLYTNKKNKMNTNLKKNGLNLIKIQKMKMNKKIIYKLVLMTEARKKIVRKYYY